jgi:hypothetical protein
MSTFAYVLALFSVVLLLDLPRMQLEHKLRLMLPGDYDYVEPSMCDAKLVVKMVCKACIAAASVTRIEFCP